LAAALALAFFGCETDANDTPVIVCFGDSLTEGYGAGTGTAPPECIDKTKSYPAFLAKKVTAKVVNAGVSGDTPADGLARIDTDVLSYDPQVVVVGLAANDFLPLFYTATGSALAVSETQRNLEAIIDKLYAGSSGAKRKVYLAKFYTDDVFEDMKTLIPLAATGIIDNPLAGLSDEQVKAKVAAMEAIKPQYDAMYEALNTKYAGTGFKIIEDIWSGVWSLSVTSEFLFHDHIHPNAAGYEKQAELYFEVMEPYLALHNMVR